MLKFTDADNEPVFIRADEITAITVSPWEDNRPNKLQANTRIHIGSNNYDVVEAPGDVAMAADGTKS